MHASISKNASTRNGITYHLKIKHKINYRESQSEDIRCLIISGTLSNDTFDSHRAPNHNVIFCLKL